METDTEKAKFLKLNHKINKKIKSGIKDNTKKLPDKFTKKTIVYAYNPMESKYCRGQVEEMENRYGCFYSLVNFGKFKTWTNRILKKVPTTEEVKVKRKYTKRVKT